MVEGNSFENYTASIFGWGISPGSKKTKIHRKKN